MHTVRNRSPAHDRISSLNSVASHTATMILGAYIERRTKQLHESVIMTVPSHAIHIAHLLLDGVVSQSNQQTAEDYNAISLILDEIVNGVSPADDDRFTDAAAIAIVCIGRLSAQLASITGENQLEIIAELREFLDSLSDK